MKIDTVLRAVASEPWAIIPEKLDAICEVLALRANAGQLSADDIAARVGDSKSSTGARRAGKVAVLPVYGVISQRMNMFQQISGGTSTELLGKQFDEALNDTNCSAIVLDVDSPGGRTEGVEELATRIYNARGQKPIIAVANSLAASAAYWIASACDEVVAAPSATVGSIGVYMVHTSYARMAANEGIDYTVIRAGKYKAEGLPGEPLSAEARAYAQQMVDDCYDLFCQAVARGRNCSVTQVRGGMGEGRVVPSRRALSAGMVDRVATLDEVINELVAGTRQPKMRGRAARADGVALAAAAPLVTAGGGVFTHQIDTQLLAAADALHLSAPDLLPVAAEGAPTEPIVALETPASQAEEIPVPEPTTAAPAQHGAGIDAAQFAELKRRDDIRVLANQHTRQADADAWISSGASVEQVRQQILTEYAAGAKPVVQVGKERELQKPFASFAEQVGAIQLAAVKPHLADRRLFELNAAAAGMGGNIASDGGFAIQQDLVSTLLEPIYDTGAILSRVRRIPIGEGKNGVKFWAIDETSRVTGSRFGGIQMYWGDEGDTATATKPKFRGVELALKKLIGLAYQTDELLEDLPAMASILEQAFRQELEFMLEDSVVNGDGIGKPQGVQNSSALVTQAIEGTQTIANTATFITANLAKMKSRMPARLFADAVWLMNPDLEPKLITATLGGTSAAFPVYMPPGGLSGSPYGTVLGRPVIFNEYCAAEGTPGDILLVNLGEYAMADKNGIKTATSMHVRFLTDEQAFRITYRTDGQPLWKTAVTPAKGANTRSPFVALATRS